MSELAKVKPETMRFDQLMLNIRDGKIRIPNFQRDFVWEQSQIIRLLDSIYNHYPIGSLLFWETNEEIQSYRRVGEVELLHDDERSVQYVLDGQQRVTSLFASLKQASIQHKVNGKKIKKSLKIYFDLDEKKFVSNPFERKESQVQKKRESLRDIPDCEDYVKFLKDLLHVVKTEQPTRDRIMSWLESHPRISSERAYGIDSQSKTMKLYKETSKGCFLAEQGEALLTGNDLKPLVSHIFETISHFGEMLPGLLEKGRFEVTEMSDHLSLSSPSIVKPYKVQARFHWLAGLGLGSFDSKEFVLSEDGRDCLNDVLEYAEAKEQKKKDLELEKKKRYFSVLQITDMDQFVKTASELDSDRRTRLLDVRTRFESYPFSVIHVLEQPIETACEIFERINNSGKILNVVDLVVAKSWSTTFNLRVRLDDFRAELKKEGYEEIPDIRIIQCLSVIVNKKARRSDILGIQRSIVEENWERTLKAIRLAIDFLKTNLKVTHAKILPYNSCLVPITFYFDAIQTGEQDNEKRKALEQWFWKISLSNRYDMAAETKIGEDVQEMIKLVQGEEAFLDYEPAQLSLNRILSQKLNLNSAFCKTILCALYQRDPKDFKDGAPVSLTSFSKFNATELHHVFPVAYLRDEDPESYKKRDCIANIALAKSSANKQYSSHPPSRYLKECGNNKLKDALASHLIPDLSKSGLFEDDFETFVNYRGQEILQEVKKLSGEMSEIEADMTEDNFAVIENFEHRMRAFIHTVLSKKDPNYWQNCLNPEFRDRVQDRIDSWIKEVPGRSIDDVQVLDHCTIFDHFKIIKQNWSDFSDLISSKSQLEEKFKKISDYRNAAGHFREIDELQSREAETALLWFERVFDAAKIPQ